MLTEATDVMNIGTAVFARLRIINNANRNPARSFPMQIETNGIEEWMD
jgi:hypothetical protein